MEAFQRRTEGEIELKGSDISPDFKITEPVFIKTGETLVLPARQDQEYENYIERRQRTGSPVLTVNHSRSHLTQLGLVAQLTQDTADWLSSPGSEKTFTPRVQMTNYSPRSFHISEGAGVCSLASFYNLPLNGDEIQKRLKNHEIVLSTDTYLISPEGQLVLPLDPDIQYGITKGKDPVVLNGQSGTNHNRDLVAQHLEEIGQTAESRFWVGALLPHVYLSPNVHGVIVGSRCNGDTFPLGESRITGHLPSTLLTGGHTGESPDKGNEIRTEAFGPTKGYGRMHRVHILLFEA